MTHQPVINGQFDRSIIDMISSSDEKLTDLDPNGINPKSIKCSLSNIPPNNFTELCLRNSANIEKEWFAKSSRDSLRHALLVIIILFIDTRMFHTQRQRESHNDMI